MANCVVPNCPNRTRKGFRLHRFPSDKKRRAKWAARIQKYRQNWTPNDSSRICCEHFDASQYEQNRADGLKRLKPNAVPTIFNFENLKIPVSTEENSQSNDYSYEVIQVLTDIADCHDTDDLENVLIPDLHENVNDIETYSTDATDSAAVISSLRNRIEALESERSEIIEIIEILNKENQSLKEKEKKSKRELSKLKAILTKEQLELLEFDEIKLE